MLNTTLVNPLISCLHPYKEISHLTLQIDICKTEKNHIRIDRNGPN